MPESRYFRVTQMREVEVTANSAVDAARIASAAFDKGQNSAGGVNDGPDGVWGNTTSRIKIIDLSISLER